MDQYRIHHSLLIPKPLLLRLDILPFLIAYSILTYCFLTFEDAGNTYIYMRLTFVALGFLNCLTYIFGHWSKKVQAKIQYNVIKGSMKQNLLKASHVYVREKIPGYAWSHGICDLYMVNLQSKKQQQVFFFYFQQRKFVFSKQKDTFVRLKPQLTNLQTKQLLAAEYETQLYDDNILKIPIKPFSQIFKDQIVDPFQFFQLFSVLLWMLDENAGYSFFILLMILFSAYTIAAQRIKTLVGYRSMTLAPHQVKTWKNGKWTSISSYDLKPGDLIIVQPGYQHKKCPHETISDQEFLSKALPFSSAIPQKMMQQTTKKPQQNQSYRTVPCDILLLSGSCVANESILTGQAIPQIKQSITPSDLSNSFNPNQYKHNILFCGTEMLQINDNLHNQQIRAILKRQQILAEMPVKGCLGMVLATGFDTSKGKLIRRVVANAQNLKLEQKDGLWIVLFLLICSLITSAYVLDQGMANQERSKQKLFLRCILIITTVVPPQLPMIMTLTVNNSILQLQKRKIFISEPKKIPLGGKISTIAFDKTGTLTEDKFNFEGIVDDCQNYQNKKNFKNCKNQNCVVLAGCHSLIMVEDKLSGDPIQLMFFNETDWSYSSKNKEARRNLQRVIINKVYPFRSQLKRMSTIVQHIPMSGPSSMKVLVKGAPQAIQKLLKTVPKKYDQAYKFYTKQGYRLLALAYKNLNGAIKQHVDKDEERAEVEKDLEFAGFFICNSPLKEDTLKNIQNLQQAKFKILIITGDNILTAIKVGLTLKMGTQPYILQVQDGKTVLMRGQQHYILSSVTDLKKYITDPNSLVCTSSSKQLSPQYYPYITIFARTSPQDKQNIVKKIKQLTGVGILYAGDGTNDMGGLRTADVGVAVVGTTAISETQKKQDEYKQAEKRMKKRIDQIRMDPAIPFKEKIQMSQRLAIEHRQKYGGVGMMGFLQQDQVKVGDACFAAPFTSKHSNSIKCVLIILRQSIATLVTTIQTYKILAISSMIQAYSLAQMNLINLKYSQSQTLIVGILASINLYYFSNVKPVKKISHIRAPHTIWNIWFGLSFFGQIVIFIFCNYYALNKIGLKYLPEADKKVSADTEFQKSFLNTVIFLFSAISQSTVFISNHGGQPHMMSLLKSGKQFKFLIIPLVVCFIITANIFPDLTQMFDLKYQGIPFQANLQMLAVFGFMVVSTFLLERLCRFGQYKEFVGWF